ncbi:FGGY family carbohydrate kinase [uncultured Serinicoccus sp.]|uniref:xylulokinase n=1 Tax=uncultured Serinicoccus sp. TaxID=735514 RepID=UPI00262F1B51|nr:FGGY family carbohydrate kinase [uncultured Serinicoccus sp.]
MSAVVMGVDSSTQSCTVELRDVDSGVLRAQGRAAHPRTSPPVSEQHPDRWWAALAEASRQALAALDAPAEVVGVSVGAQCHGMVLTDAAGEVVRPAKLWNDTTSAPQARSMLDSRGAAWWANQVGLLPSAAITITKLAWLAEHESSSIARAHRLHVPHDWLTFRLTGEHVTDRSDASGTGYYSSDTGRWRPDLLEEFVGERDWAATLPHVLQPEEAAGRVTEEAAAALGIPAGAVVAPGGGDQHLAAQGVGLRPGDRAYSLGTSGVVIAHSGGPVHDVSGEIDGVADVTGHWLPLVCTLNATKVTDTVASLLAVDHATLGELALAAPVTPHRPVLAAFLDGERSPRLPHARGMLAGLTGDLTREQLALAAVEGVVLGLWRGARRIADFGVPGGGRSIVLGGGARSAAYRQVIADLSGTDTITVDAPEATARGAAVQAAALVHGETVADMTRRWEPGTVTTDHPRDDRAAGLVERYERLASLQADGTTF